MVKKYSLALGLVFLIVGVLGFVDSLTPNGMLLGVFAVNPVHNLIHIVFGVLGIGMAFSHTAEHVFPWLLLIVYGAVTVLGFLMTPDQGMLLGLVHMNAADNFLHLAISLSALVVILLSRRSHRMA